jgi:Na+-translocating ferredoxin:NAD+ oxidoreductase RnfC subunit
MINPSGLIVLLPGIYSVFHNCRLIENRHVPIAKQTSKMTKINFLVAHITESYKFSISPIPEAHPQILQKNTAKIITDITLTLLNPD